MRHGLHQLRDLGFQMIVRDDQRAYNCAHVAVANGDRLIDSRL